MVENCRAHRSEEHTSELQSLRHLVCRLLLEKKKKNTVVSGRIGWRLRPRYSPRLFICCCSGRWGSRPATHSNMPNNISVSVCFFFLKDPGPPKFNPFPPPAALPI